MDDHSRQDSRRRRHNEPLMNPSSNPRYFPAMHDPPQQEQRRSYTGVPADRLRPPSLNPSASATGRAIGNSVGYGAGYYQEPSATTFTSTAMPQGALGYQQSPTDYAQADTRQAQSFGASTYNPTTMMYNVQQPAGAQNSSGVYDTSQQFPSRQPAALQMMPTEVGAPYFASEPANTTPAPSSMQPQVASTSQHVYQPSSLPGYPSGIASIGGMAPQTNTAAEASMEDQGPSTSSQLEDTWASYQSELKEVFRSIQRGMLAPASTLLLRLSDWLLSHVPDLGLHLDDPNLHGQRIEVWNEFNHAWLAILQRQKDMVESNQQLQRPQTVISQEGLETMGRDLVRLCDGVERYGLVDYQYGVWEERIIAILEDCLDQYEVSDDADKLEAGSSSRQ